ncbi:MAG TPA: AlpA family phage regulatory protein [Burkholderiaceae bacterium]|jgi:prophage regulatory protein
MHEQTIYRLPQVLERVRVSRSTLYNWIKAGKFKRPLELGPRAIGWLSSDIDDYIQSRVDLRQRPLEKIPG